jgi:hypothetical protein
MIVKMLTHMHMMVYTWWYWHTWWYGKVLELILINLEKRDIFRCASN